MPVAAVQLRRIVCLSWLLFLAAVCSPPAPAADQALIDLIHPDTNFVVAFQPWSLYQTPSARFSMEESERLGLPQPERPEWAELQALLGPEPLRYFEEVLLSAHIRSFDERTEPEHVLLILRGPWDDALVESVCERSGGCQAERYRDFTIRWPVDGDAEGATAPTEGSFGTAYFVVLDSRYAVFGKRVDIENTLDRRAMGDRRALNPPMAEWFRGLNESHFWFAAQGPFDWPPESREDAEETPALWKMIAAALKDTFAKIDSTGFSFHLDPGLKLSLKLGARTAQDAQAFSGTVQGWWNKVQEQTEQDASIQKQLDGRFELKQQGRFLTASLIVPQQELEQQIRTQLARRADEMKQSDQQRGEASGQPSAPQPAARRRRPGGIIIEGLSSEPVEVPTTRP